MFLCIEDCWKNDGSVWVS